MTHARTPCNRTPDAALSCYRLLRDEIARRLARQGRWQGMPALLDELDALRRLRTHVPPAASSPAGQVPFAPESFVPAPFTPVQLASARN